MAVQESEFGRYVRNTLIEVIKCGFVCVDGQESRAITEVRFKPVFVGVVRVRTEHRIDVPIESKFVVSAGTINVVVAPIRAVAVFEFQVEQRRDSNGDGVNVRFGAAVEMSRFLRHVSLGSHNMVIYDSLTDKLSSD